MFDFFKKNKLEQPEAAKNISAQPAVANRQGVQDQVLNEQVKVDNIAIHVMAARFRNQSVKQDSAKTTGMIIIIGGAVFLLIASAALYYFLFKKPSVTINEELPIVTESNQLDQKNQDIAELNQTTLNPDTATGTASTTLPFDSEIATTTVATTTTETISTAEGLSLSIGMDSDNDGLTDVEEIILNTSTTTADTDGDGYTDGSELINLYNPAGKGKITENTAVASYENKTFAYNLLYLSTWQTSINGGDDSLMFRSADNQFVQIIVQPNVNKITLEEWYMEQLGVLTVNEADRVSGLNWQGVKSPDGLNIYLMDRKQNYIFSLTYNPGGGNILEYTNIFQMMVKSFNFKD
jgi:hypothetical protein